MEQKRHVELNELREKAEQKVQAKMTFFTCVIVFSFVSLILIMLSFYLPEVSFWLMLPLPAFVMVLGVLYLSAFGLPFSGNSDGDWKEDEIEKEMIKLYRQKKRELPPLEELSDEDILELKELERIKRKWGWDENYL